MTPEEKASRCWEIVAEIEARRKEIVELSEERMRLVRELHDDPASAAASYGIAYRLSQFRDRL